MKPETEVVLDVPGSNVIVAGTAIFGAENPETVIAGLKESVSKALEARSGT